MSSKENTTVGEQPTVGEEPDPSLCTSWLSKYLAVLGLLATTVVSVILIIGNKKSWVLPGSFHDVVRNNRASVQTVVQTLSSLLGAVYTYTFCTIINFSTRISLTDEGVSLGRMRFWTALSANKLNWSLSPRYFAISVLFFMLNLVPAALWAAALTPITGPPTSKQNTTQLNIPRYSDTSATFWSGKQWYNAALPIQNNLGTFSYAPTRDLQGLIINSAASASTMDGSTQVHSKNDNSGYLYHGRSYGVGSSVGLTTDSIDNYRYRENGYNTKINCIYNESTNYLLHLAQGSNDGSIPMVFGASGNLPNGNAGGGYSLVGMGGSKTVVGVGFVAGGDIPERLYPAGVVSYIGIAAGSTYIQLNTTQCTITLIPTTFDVVVNSTEKVITVKPVLSGPSVVDIDPTGLIAYQSADAVLLSSMMEATLWTSIYGNALLTNVNNVLSQNTTESKDTKTLRGISEAFQSMVDDYLGAFASAQLMIGKDVDGTDVTVITNTTMIGQKPYIISIVVVNGLVILAFLGMTAITNRWAKLPNFDYMDMKSVVVGASIGGAALGDELLEEYKTARRDWVGNAKDKTEGETKHEISGKVMIQLRMGRPPLALVLKVAGGAQGVAGV